MPVSPAQRAWRVPWKRARIVKLFNFPPLLEGHTEEVLRVSDPALSWLRQVAIVVESDKRLDEGLLASEIVDICQAHSIEFPNKTFPTDLNQAAMYAGRLLRRVFHDVQIDDEIRIDRYGIKRQSIKQDRHTDEGGDFVKTYYRFRKRLPQSNAVDK